jgi:hypothetical protein
MRIKDTRPRHYIGKTESSRHSASPCCTRAITGIEGNQTCGGQLRSLSAVTFEDDDGADA